MSAAQPATTINERPVEAWQAWKDTYLANYREVETQINATDWSDAAAIEALLADPAYVEAMDAAAEIVIPTEESTFQSIATACS